MICVVDDKNNIKQAEHSPESPRELSTRNKMVKKGHNNVLTRLSKLPI